jgi:hypothetical protein
VAIIDVTFRSITCNGDGCEKTVTFEPKEAEATAKEHVWLRNLRIVQAAGRNFTYCSDECLLTGVEAGVFNPPEEKKIVQLPGHASATSAIQAAAAAARAAEDSTRRIKSGEGGQIQISQ